MVVGSGLRLWTLPASELAALASCGHTESQHICSLLGKLNCIVCFRSPFLFSRVPSAPSAPTPRPRSSDPREPGHLRNRELWNHGMKKYSQKL